MPRSRFRLLNYTTFGCVGVMMGAAVLVAFSYYGVSRYGIEIPTKPVCYFGDTNCGLNVPDKLSIPEGKTFKTIFTRMIRTLLYGAFAGFILIGLALPMEGQYQQNNLRSLAGFLLIFCMTSMLIGSGVIWGLSYLIDVWRFK